MGLEPTSNHWFFHAPNPCQLVRLMFVPEAQAKNECKKDPGASVTATELSGSGYKGGESNDSEQSRQRGDSNPCGQSPMDFEAISLAARTRCHVHVPMHQSIFFSSSSRGGEPQHLARQYDPEMPTLGLGCRGHVHVARGMGSFFLNVRTPVPRDHLISAKSTVRCSAN